MFAPFGKIYSLEVYRGLLSIKSCIGAKHSSLSRDLEWQRLTLRDALRPEFHVFTGNDLAIDMVMYGSDYLLGLSTFAPDLFAAATLYGKEGMPRSTNSMTYCSTWASSPSERPCPPTSTRQPCS